MLLIFGISIQIKVPKNRIALLNPCFSVIVVLSKTVAAKMATSASSGGGGDAHIFLTFDQLRGVGSYELVKQTEKTYSLLELDEATFVIDTSKKLKVTEYEEIYVNHDLEDNHHINVELQAKFLPCQFRFTRDCYEETTMKATISFDNFIGSYELVDNKNLEGVKKTIEFDLTDICEKEFEPEILELIKSETGCIPNLGLFAADKIVEIAKLYDRDTDRLELLEDCLEIRDKDGQTAALEKLFSDEGCDTAFYERMIKLHFTQEASEKLLELIETFKK